MSNFKTNLHKILCAENTKSFIFERDELVEFIKSISDNSFKNGYNNAITDIACNLFKASVLATIEEEIK